MDARWIPALLGLTLAVPAAVAQEAPSPDPVAPRDEAALQARIDDITVADVAWRQIPWKTCLLDAVATAKREQKPILVWCQIDRPIDDTRC